MVAQAETGQPAKKRKKDGPPFFRVFKFTGENMGLDLVAAVVLSEAVHWTLYFQANSKRRGWFYRTESDWLELNRTLTQQALSGRARKGMSYSQGAFIRIEQAYAEAVQTAETLGPVIERTTVRPIDFKESLKPGKRTYIRVNFPALNAWLVATGAEALT